MRTGAKSLLCRFLVVMAVLVSGAALTPISSFAQDGSYTEYFGDSFNKGSLGSEEADGSGMSGLSGAIMAISVAMNAFLKAVLGAGSVIMLAVILMRVLRGDRDSAMKLFWWMLALVAGFVIVTVMGNWNPSITAGGKGGYLSVKQEVATVLMLMMKIIATISLVLAAIHMMQGEQESLRKFLVTLVVSLMCCGLLSLIAQV